MAFIQTKRLQLCVLGGSAAAQLLQYYKQNRDFFQPWLPRYGPHFFSEAFQASVLQHENRLLRKQQQLRLFLFQREDKRLQNILGDVRFSRISGIRYAQLGYKLAQAQLGKGYMEEALRTALPFVFEHWNLLRIVAYITPENQPSQRLVHRLGFEEQPNEETYLELDGQYLLHHCFQLFRVEGLEL